MAGSIVERGIPDEALVFKPEETASVKGSVLSVETIQTVLNQQASKAPKSRLSRLFWYLNRVFRIVETETLHFLNETPVDARGLELLQLIPLRNTMDVYDWCNEHTPLMSKYIGLAVSAINLISAYAALFNRIEENDVLLFMRRHLEDEIAVIECIEKKKQVAGLAAWTQAEEKELKTRIAALNQLFTDFQMDRERYRIRVYMVRGLVAGLWSLVFSASLLSLFEMIQITHFGSGASLPLLLITGILKTVINILQLRNLQNLMEHNEAARLKTIAAIAQCQRALKEGLIDPVVGVERLNRLLFASAQETDRSAELRQSIVMKKKDILVGLGYTAIALAVLFGNGSFLLLGVVGALFLLYEVYDIWASHRQKKEMSQQRLTGSFLDKEGYERRHYLSEYHKILSILALEQKNPNSGIDKAALARVVLVGGNDLESNFQAKQEALWFAYTSLMTALKDQNVEYKVAEETLKRIGCLIEECFAIQTALSWERRNFPSFDPRLKPLFEDCYMKTDTSKSGPVLEGYKAIETPRPVTFQGFQRREGSIDARQVLNWLMRNSISNDGSGQPDPSSQEYWKQYNGLKSKRTGAGTSNPWYRISSGSPVRAELVLASSI